MQWLHWVRVITASALSLFAATAAASVAPPTTEAPAEARPDGPVFTPLLRINLRGEARTNAGNDPDPSADSWQVVEGVRAGIKASYRELTVVAQLQDVRAWGQGGILSNNPFTGLHQGYIEVAGETHRSVSGFIRLGRQEIMYGSRRHFHNSPWAPSGRAFDAVRGQLNVAKASLELSYMMADRPQQFTITDPDGIESTARGRGDHLAYGDIGYAFHEAAELHVATMLQRLGGRQSDPTRGRFFVMPGARLTGVVFDGVDYEAEGWLQRGTERTQDMRAWMAAAAVGYEAPIPIRPGARVLYEISSGNGCSGDPSLGESCENSVYRDFDHLDGARHFYRGFMDIFAGSNLRDLAGSVFVSPMRNLKASAVYHLMQMHDPTGRWYNLSGEATWGQGWDPTNTRRTLGHEIDLILNYKPWKYLSIRPAYSVFIKGPAARRLLPPDAMHFVYLWFIAEY